MIKWNDLDLCYNESDPQVSSCLVFLQTTRPLCSQQRLNMGPEETDGEDSTSPGLIPLAELAGTLKTTQSALTCGLSSRVKRVYI